MVRVLNLVGDGLEFKKQLKFLRGISDLMIIFLDSKDVLEQAELDKDDTLTFVISKDKKMKGLKDFFKTYMHISFPGEFTNNFVNDFNLEVS